MVKLKKERHVHYLANTLSLMPFSFPYCTDCTSVRPLQTETKTTVSGFSWNKPLTEVKQAVNPDHSAIIGATSVESIPQIFLKNSALKWTTSTEELSLETAYSKWIFQSYDTLLTTQIHTSKVYPCWKVRQYLKGTHTHTVSQHQSKTHSRYITASQ